MVRLVRLMWFIILMLVVLVFVYIVNKPKKSKIRQRKVKTPKQKYLLLSVFQNYLDRYDLSLNNEDSFFLLRQKILTDGTTSVSNKLKSMLTRGDEPLLEKVEKFLEDYENLLKNENKLELPKAKEGETGIKIYKEAGMPYLKEFKLEQLAEKNLQKAFFLMLSKLFDMGEKQLLKNIEQNVQWIREYKEKEDLESLKKEIERILNKLNV